MTVLKNNYMKPFPHSHVAFQEFSNSRFFFPIIEAVCPISLFAHCQGWFMIAMIVLLIIPVNLLISRTTKEVVEHAGEILQD